ncbi:DUF3073 domain-containing protein [Rugosimonospora acidiphila]|uniref:DUF3073 domain-containing protein n=1 Tax=Rugosimonospora acidiphila TaxID=556531 RepID=A0ABP9RHR0_9ACTN
MGRGRAKAKQTKVARELKYHSPNTDLAALQRELASSEKSKEHFDNYGELLDDDSDDEDDEDESDDGAWTPGRR